MHPTPANLAASYDFLRTCRPFRRWKLPPSEQVHFRVITTPAFYGQYISLGDTHQIDVSARKCTHLSTLLMTMAHEMLHLAQRVRKRDRGGEHNADFQKWARVVCNEFGFDAGSF